MRKGSSTTSVSFLELLGYAEQESRRWHEFFNKNPAALDIRVDIADPPDVKTLVKHIILVDLRYAEWLLGEPVTPVDGVSTASAADLFGAADKAFSKLRRLIETLTDEQWDEMMAFPKPMEGMQASRRKCFVHVIFHGTRHWAQLATALRAAGYKQDWQHDFLLTTAMQ